MLRRGEPAPEINLPDLNGTQWSLREALRHGPVVLAFFKISCPTCQFTFPFLQRLADSRGGNLQLMAISQDAAPDAFEFHQRFGLSMPTLIDSGPRYSASNAYKITSVPSIFLVEVDGLIGSAFEGFNRKELEKLGGRFQTIPFRGNETVPDLRPG